MPRILDDRKKWYKSINNLCWAVRYTRHQDIFHAIMSWNILKTSMDIVLEFEIRE